MPEAQHSVDVRATPAAVWAFVSNMDRWAPLVPGYISHARQSDTDSTWTLKGDVGILVKTVTFQVRITEWLEPHTVRFTLAGVNERVSGGGSFLAVPVADGVTRVTGSLELRQEGSLAPMVNALFKGVLPKVARGFVETLARQVERGTAGL